MCLPRGGQPQGLPLLTENALLIVNLLPNRSIVIMVRYMMLNRVAKPVINPTLVLMSGLPGCGKSTLARVVAKRIGIPIFAKDRFQSLLRRNGLAGRATADGYHLLLDMADEQLSLGISVVLDAVFPQEGFRQAAAEIAMRHGAYWRPIYCFCSDTAVWQQRLDQRQHTYVPHWSPVGWEEVERLRQLFIEWSPREALMVDSIDSLDVNLQKVLAWLDMPY